MDTRWKQKEVTWSELCQELTATHRTSETTLDYFQASKDRKTEIKDIGGFVGGPVDGGRRVHGSVRERSLITLDMDNVSNDDEALDSVYDILQNSYGCDYCIYSTHSHTPANPRYRLVIPLSRNVDPDEYEAVSRRIADEIGIDLMDDTTYQTERLMFWPSTSSDGVFYEDHFDNGSPLNPDEVLATYRDWRDVSQWPTSSRTETIVRRGIQKQADPTTKAGIVGAFCRTYDVHDAIAEFLTDIYAPTTDKNRYTYVHGSSACGLVIYQDGKFAFSNHATDPASGHLCNAFDLVRLHKFGNLDEEAREGTPSNRLPSFSAMADLANSDEEVHALLTAEAVENADKRHQAVASDFETDEPEDTDKKAPEDWAKLLTRDKKGIEQTDDNAYIIVKNHKSTRGLFRYDRFVHEIVLTRDYFEHSLSKDGETLVDNDIQNVKMLLQKFGIKMGKDIVAAIIEKVARGDSYHPVEEYFKTLAWDGTPRLETVFIDYNGVIDTPAVREASRTALTAAVARIMEPGCKFDYVVTLAGPEKTGKSTIVKKLALDKWDQEGLPAMNNSKESSETLNGVMLVEISELVGMRKSEVEDVKSFISRRVDKYRPAYKRYKETNKRQCIFIATTNETGFLKGSTGNRRWWIFRIGTKEAPKSIKTLDRETVGQIWAEAIENYRSVPRDADGDPVLELSEASELEMMKYQADYNDAAEDDNLALLRDWLDGKTVDPDFIGDPSGAGAKSKPKTRVCNKQIFIECFGGLPSEYTNNQAKHRSYIKSLMALVPEWEVWRGTIPGYGNINGYKRK